ncbi:hypothetical protein [Arhodomonas sp. AD133]|uniref:hypothetical protein n=1 Tax=Arhodomonas sp. AD133 TaxID=3415009 RepID=UPI003EBB9D0A
MQETPETLRAAAREIRAGAQYADGAAYTQDLTRARELDERANRLEREARGEPPPTYKHPEADALLGFGTYGHRTWRQVPTGYLRWITRKFRPDQYRRRLAERELRRRGHTVY